MTEIIRVTVDLTGILQGVGFRPTLARLVTCAKLSGWTRNQSGSVRLVLAGPQADVEEFVSTLPQNLPEQAQLETLRVVSTEKLPPNYDEDTFLILESQSADKIRISIPADLAICDNCRAEVLDSRSRYYGYPFTTCTNCGPRYTVVDCMPYDRERTSLKQFPLCTECRNEYSDSFNRRFHAQSIACPKCGPSLSIFDAKGCEHKTDALQTARCALANGKVVAIRGMGGFLLAVDALNTTAIDRLREKKQRPAKPFAVMAKNVSVARQYCLMDSPQEEIMKSSKAPIVILDLRPEYIDDPRFQSLAPNTGTLGVMLPTTPLHLLLAHSLDFDSTKDLDFLVMTSGNRGGEPICISNQDAFERLKGIADYFLCHNREINFRCDDSLVGYAAGKMRLLRRSRGFAPRSLRLHKPLKKKYLAFGADLKNTVALGYNDEIVVSPHIGNLETVSAIEGLSQVVDTFPGYFEQSPDTVVVDMHPDMQSVRIGEKYAEANGLALHRVQHHHAHGAAVMAEHGLESGLGLILDGTGYGTDGNIWGAELLHIYPGAFKRLGTFSSASLPGGDAAVIQPVRQLLARWFDVGVQCHSEWLSRLGVSNEAYYTWQVQCQKKINTVQTHAAGRVFDAFSVLLGISPSAITYEGQGAIWLEAVARRCNTSAQEVPFEVRMVNKRLEIDFSQAFSMFAQRFPQEDEIAALALGFHHAIVRAGAKMANFGREMTGTNCIVLSGGVMMNRLICEQLFDKLKSDGFRVFLPSLVPVNDGGISLGQIYAVGGNGGRK